MKSRSNLGGLRGGVMNEGSTMGESTVVSELAVFHGLWRGTCQRTYGPGFRITV